MNGPKGSNFSYYAPIVEWRTCKVWDFLMFVAPRVGWPTAKLFELYGNQDLRFGCWTCTLVRRDKTVEELMTRPGMERLAMLHDFRERIWQETKEVNENRVLRSDGKAGPINLATRGRLLEALLNLQDEYGEELITEEEIEAIHREWKKDNWRNR